NQERTGRRLAVDGLARFGRLAGRREGQERPNDHDQGRRHDQPRQSGVPAAGELGDVGVRMRMSILAILIVALLSGCGPDARDGKAPPPPSPVAVTTSTIPAPKTPPLIEPETKPIAEPWGTIKGRIVWGDKEIPKRPTVTVPTTNNDHKFCTKDG